MADDTQNRSPTTGSRRLVRCDQCGRSNECSASELLRYTRQGWPKCCGQVMGLFIEAEKPGPDDTALDRRPVPPET